MTPLTELQDFFATAAENSARMFRKNGQVLPMWHAVDGDDEHALIATPWRNDDEKDIASDALREMFRAQKVKRFAFICEAWIVEAVLGEVALNTRPSIHQDRREVLMIAAEDREGNSLSGF